MYEEEKLAVWVRWQEEKLKLKNLVAALVDDALIYGVFFLNVNTLTFTVHVNAKRLEFIILNLLYLAGRVWLPILVDHTAEPVIRHVQKRCMFSLWFWSRYCIPHICPSSLYFPDLCVVIRSPLCQNRHSP